jgi:hypothetical protein
VYSIRFTSRSDPVAARQQRGNSTAGAAEPAGHAVKSGKRPGALFGQMDSQDLSLKGHSA